MAVRGAKPVLRRRLRFGTAYGVPNQWCPRQHGGVMPVRLVAVSSGSPDRASRGLRIELENCYHAKGTAKHRHVNGKQF